MQYLSDQTIFHWLLELRVAHSQYHLSALCGRSPGWFSSTRCQGRQASSAALLILVQQLDRITKRETDWLRAQQLRLVIQRMKNEIIRRAECTRRTGAKREQGVA